LKKPQRKELKKRLKSQGKDVKSNENCKEGKGKKKHLKKLKKRNVEEQKAAIIRVNYQPRDQLGGFERKYACWKGYIVFM
jgi:hypothetical protein